MRFTPTLGALGVLMVAASLVGCGTNTPPAQPVPAGPPPAASTAGEDQVEGLLCMQPLALADITSYDTYKAEHPAELAIPEVPIEGEAEGEDNVCVLQMTSDFRQVVPNSQKVRDEDAEGTPDLAQTYVQTKSVLAWADALYRGQPGITQPSGWLLDVMLNRIAVVADNGDSFRAFVVADGILVPNADGGFLGNIGTVSYDDPSEPGDHPLIVVNNPRRSTTTAPAPGTRPATVAPVPAPAAPSRPATTAPAPARTTTVAPAPTTTAPPKPKPDNRRKCKAGETPEKNNCKK